MLHSVLRPADDERVPDGSVPFTADRLICVLGADTAGGGVALVHSQLGHRWQNMSAHDVIADGCRVASAVACRTELPLLGPT